MGSTQGFDDFDLTTGGHSRGEVTSGVKPNRDNDSFPDDEQARREQARQESEWAAGERADHPSNTRQFPNRHVREQLEAAEA